MKLKKNFTKVILFMTLLFVAWNMLWLLNYKKYLDEALDYNLYKNSRGKKIDDYNLTIKAPNYLSFTGNYAIVKENITFIVWPNLLLKGEKKYGLMLFDAVNNHGYIFYVDGDMNYIYNSENTFSENEINAINNVLNDNRSEINKMKNLAKKEWNLVFEKSE